MTQKYTQKCTYYFSGLYNFIKPDQFYPLKNSKHLSPSLKGWGSPVICETVRSVVSCFRYWSLVCPVVWGRGLIGVFGGKIKGCIWTKPLALVSCSVPEFHPCIVVAMTSVLLSTETADAHTHSPSVSSQTLLVVEEALLFCADMTLVSSKHLGFVHRRTFKKKQTQF